MKLNIDKKTIIYFVSFFVLFVIFGVSIFFSSRIDSDFDVQILEGIIVFRDDNIVTICDINGNEYIVSGDIDAMIGDDVSLKYTGALDLNSGTQNIEILDYTVMTAKDEDIPDSYKDNGIFSEYYSLAYDKLKELSLDEKIGQLLLVRYPDGNQKELLKEYGFAGYVFFGEDFKDKNKVEVQNMMESLQEASDIPIITAVDEEGGKIVRISSNLNLRDSAFLSSSELYSLGGFDRIKEDTKEKSRLLKSLGVNVNLAPVVDVSTDSSDYMYERTIKEDTDIVSEYAKTVIEASKGTGVSYTLKHFPGYGSNDDTHTGTSLDDRSLEDIMSNDLPPFEVGIEAGAEAVLVSHNIVSSIDTANPASLSPNVHSLLRDDLGFTGVIITDDLAMDATSGITDVAVFAVKAGNNLIITTDYEESFNSIKTAVETGDITEDEIDELVFKVLAWKYYKGLMFQNLK